MAFTVVCSKHRLRGQPLNTEFEMEQKGPRRLLEDLIAAAKDRLRHGPLDYNIFLDGKRLDTADLAQDQVEFVEQERRLDGRRGLVVELEDEQAISSSRIVAVPVDLDLRQGHQLNRRVSDAADRLSNVGFHVRRIEPGEVHKAFVNRVAETLAMRAFAATSFGHGPLSDIVSSTNNGDDILCAKGWFLSTGHIVGQSTCPLSVKPGRYSLGVCHGRLTRYHPQLFNLPIGTIHLNLP